MVIRRENGTQSFFEQVIELPTMAAITSRRRSQTSAANCAANCASSSTSDGILGGGGAIGEGGADGGSESLPRSKPSAERHVVEQFSVQ